MPKFKYSARNVEGGTVNGTLSATDQQAALSVLRKGNLTPMSIEAAGGIDWDKLKSFQFGGPKVKLDEMVLFTRQMSTMVGAGIPLLEALEIMEEQVDNKGFKKALGTVVDDVRQGGDLSDSLGKHKTVFPDIYVNMIRAGEASGQLDEILNRLAGYLEANAKLRSEIKSAMTYPVISLIMILGITTFLMVGIIPKFKDMFDNLGVELPFITVFVLGISNFMTTKLLYIVGGCVAVFFALRAYVKTESGAVQKDWLMLHIPVFGNLLRKVSLSRFAKTFSTLIKSGVPILGALEIVSATAGNRIVSATVDAARENVRQGENLSGPLAKSTVFPPMVVKMIAIGEKSGALENLLEKISEFYDQQVEATVAGLTALIEPLMIGVMGIIVGTIILAIFWPIMKIQEALTKGG